MILLGCLGIGGVAARRPVPLVVPLLLAVAFAAARWRGHGGIGALDALHLRFTFEGILGLSALSIGRTLAAGGRALPSGVWAVAAAAGAEAFGYVHLLPAVAFALYWATDARDRDAGAALAAAGAWSAGRSLVWSVLLPDHTWDGVASEVAVGLAMVAAGPRPALLGWAALGLAGAAPYTYLGPQFTGGAHRRQAPLGGGERLVRGDVAGGQGTRADRAVARRHPRRRGRRW